MGLIDWIFPRFCFLCFRSLRGIDASFCPECTAILYESLQRDDFVRGPIRGCSLFSDSPRGRKFLGLRHFPEYAFLSKAFAGLLVLTLRDRGWKWPEAVLSIREEGCFFSSGNRSLLQELKKILRVPVSSLQRFSSPLSSVLIIDFPERIGPFPEKKIDAFAERFSGNIYLFGSWSEEEKNLKSISFS